MSSSGYVTRSYGIAVAFVLFMVSLFALPAASAAAFGVSNFALTPSSKQAAGHPTLTLKFNRLGTTQEDLRSLRVEYPEGQLFNPEAAVTKCSDVDFNADTCPSASYVGSVYSLITRDWLWNPTYIVRGSIYVIDSGGGEDAVLGYVLRPTFSPKVMIKQAVDLIPGSSSQLASSTGAANQQSWWFPNVFGTRNISVRSFQATYNSRSNTTRSGPYFVLNPSDCYNKTARLFATSYQGVTSSASFQWTPTGCTSVPYAPTLQAATGSVAPGQATGLTTTVDVPTTDATIQHSATRSVVTDLPDGSALNQAYIAAINGGQPCTATQLTNDACPSATRVGSVAASMPFYPPGLSGDIYLVDDPAGEEPRLAAVARGARGLRIDLHGRLVQSGNGSTWRASVEWSSPHYPLGHLVVDVDAPLLKNPTNCVDPLSIRTTASAYSGRVAVTESPLAIICEPPATQIDSAPDAVVSESRQAIEFSSDGAGLSFECSIDGGAWAPCDSPFVQDYTDGSHVVEVRAVGYAGPDPTPERVEFFVDTQQPQLTVDPVTTLTSDSTPSISFNASDPAPSSGLSTRCSTDSGASALCTSPYTPEPLGDGSHTVTIEAVDGAGNASTSTTSFVVDSTPPIVIQNTPTSEGYYNGDPLDVDLQVIDANPGTNECSVDGASFGPCPETIDLPDGEHTFCVRSTDAAGNQSEECATFYIDGTPPTVILHNPQAQIYGGYSLYVSWDVMELHLGTTECTLDGVSASCSDALDLDDGSHTYTVTHTDGLGNVGSAAVTFVVDSLPPQLALNSPADGGLYGAGSIALAYDHSDANPGSVQCSIDGGAYAPCPASLNLTDGAHTVCVRARDAAFNETTRCSTFTVDKTAPEIIFTSPDPGSWHNTSTVQATFTVTDAHTWSTQCATDSGSFTACSSPFTTATLSEGTHTIRVRATDAAGNTRERSVSISVDRTPPPASITRCRQNTNASATCEFTAGDTYTRWVEFPPGYVGVCVIGVPSPCNGDTGYWETVDGSGVASKQCAIDSNAFTSCSSPWTSAILSQGSHVFRLRVTDFAGNVTNRTLTFTIDTIPPVVTITSPPGELILGNSPPLTFTINDANPGTSSCSLDGAAFASCPSTLGPVSDGSHVITVRHTDTYGNLGTSSSTFEVDTTPPVVQITSPAGTVYGGDLIPVWFTVSDAHPAYSDCSVDGGPYAQCPSALDLPDGQHELSVRSIDAAGNTGVASVTFIVDTHPNPMPVITSPVNGTLYDGQPVPLTYVPISSSTITCGIDGGPYATCPTSLDLSDGTHSVTLRVVYADGSVGTATSTFTVDGTAPFVAIGEPADGATYEDGPITPTFTVSDANPGSSACQLDGAPVSCSGSLDVDDGSHTFTVSHTDTAGNVGSAVSTFTVSTPNVQTGYIQVSVGYYTTCALRRMSAAVGDTHIECWGIDGRTLTGGSGSSTTPQTVLTSAGGPPLTGVTQISIGSYHLCALMVDTTLRCWGFNRDGQTGTSSTATSVAYPTTVVSGPGSSAPLTGVTGVTAGAGQTCALLAGGALKCWGYGGWVGDGTSTSRTAPVDVVTSSTDSTPLTGVTSVSAGGYHTCASLVDTTVRCWGSNGTHAINGSSTDQIIAPVPIYTNGGTSGTPLTGIASVNGGGWSSCALTTDQKAVCWGADVSGDLGRGLGAGGWEFRPEPGYVVGASGSATPVSPVTSVDPSGRCLITADTSLSCWGGNTSGQVGDGSTIDRDHATPVHSGPGDSTQLDNVVQVDSGTAHACAVLSNGAIVCWGENEQGSIGDGTTVDRYEPVLAGSSTPDVVAPLVTITSPTPGLKGASSHTLTFAVVEANPGVTECSVDGGAWSPCSSGGQVGPLSDGPHAISVRHTDVTGNVGSASVAITVDTTDPVIAISSPADGSTVASSSVPVAFTVADDNPGVSRCSLDSAPLGPCPSVLSGLGWGMHNLTVEHTDAAGNVATSTSQFDYVYENWILINSPGWGITYDSSTIPVSIDADPMMWLECSLDGAPYSPCPGSIGPLADGAHTLAARGTDPYGNVTSNSVTFTVDTIAPVVVINSPENGSVATSMIVPVDYDVVDASATTEECSLNGAPFAACPASVTVDPHSSNVFCVEAVDAAGNTGTSCATFDGPSDVFVDTTIVSGPESGLAITDPTPAWEFESDLPGASFECNLDGDGWAPCASPYTVPDDRGTGGPNGFDTGDGAGGAPDGVINADEAGSHVFEVRATSGPVVDSSPDAASFEVAPWDVNLSVTTTDPSDPTDVDGNDAGAHPDVAGSITSSAGDLDSYDLSWPNYTWLAEAVVPACTIADASSGACLPVSQIGEISVSADVNRLPHDGVAGLHSLTLSGPVFLTQQWAPGEHLGAVARLEMVDIDGHNYGQVNLRIRVLLDHVSTDNILTPVEENTSVSGPRGSRVIVDALPALSPLAVDGARLELSDRTANLTLWGERPHYEGVLTHNSADCFDAPHPDTSRSAEWGLQAIFAGATVDEAAQPHSFDRCEDLPFAPLIEEMVMTDAVGLEASTADPSKPVPRLTDFDGDLIPETPTALLAHTRVTVPSGNSSLRRATIDLPPSVKQRVAGMTNLCEKSDTQRNEDIDIDNPADGVPDMIDYVNCNVNTTMIGELRVQSPLFATEQSGQLFFEDEPASSLPSIYGIVSNSTLGLNARFRARYEIVSPSGGIGFIRASFNTSSISWQPAEADLTSAPLTSIEWDLAGSVVNGPIFEVSSGCQKHDAGHINASSWSDADLDSDGRTISVMGPKMHFGTPDSPCLPVDTDLSDDPAQPGQSPTAGDVVNNDSPSWTASRAYTNSNGTTRYVWFECSTDNALWRACGDFTPSQNEVQRLLRTGTVPSGTQTYTLTFTHPVTGASETTAPISKLANASFVQTQLEALAGINPGDVIVSGSPPASATNSFTFSFQGALANVNVPAMSVTPSTTPTWSPATLSIMTVTPGIYGDWATQVEAVPNGATITHSRVVRPQDADRPLATGDSHKFAVRLKSSATMPSLAIANSGDPVGVEPYNSPFSYANNLEIPFKVDTDVPTGTEIIDGPADGATTGDSPIYLFGSDELTSHFQCNVDGDGWEPCPSGQSLPGSPFASGSAHTFEVRAWDGANVDPSPVSRSFTVAP